MKYFKIALFLFLLPLTTQAQHLEGGVFLGASTYYGDLDPANLHLESTHFGYGLLGRYNVNDYVNIRLGINRGTLSADDANQDDEGIRARNLSFRSTLTEISLIPEFNILGFNPYDRIISPYVFLGLSYFRFNPEAEYEGQFIPLQPLGTEGQGMPGRQTRYNLSEFAVPFGVGVKFSVSEYWNIGFEAGWRWTFTDYLDDVSTTYVDRDDLIVASGENAANLANRTGEYLGTEPINIPGAGRGNPNTNDWYVFTGITFTYNFLDGIGGGKKYGCPTNF